jgi:hypothetical protein
MKKFIYTLLLFVTAFFIFDKIFIFFIYLAPNSEIDMRLEQLITGKINKECIVIGSSRGARNIIAKQIEKGTGLSTYNLSYPGSDIEFHEFLLRSLLKFNQKPKIVLLAVDDPSELLPSESIKFRLDLLYPIVKYTYINNELIARGEKNYLSKILCLSRINKSNFDLRKKHFSALDTIIDCGSMPISFQRENRIFKYDTINQYYLIKNELTNKVNAFTNFQQMCNNNGIKLYVVFSPNFRQHNFLFEKRIKELTNNNLGYFIYDFSNIIYKDKSYFYDEAHLQTKGARIFTDELVKFLNTEKAHGGNKGYMQ